MSNPLINSVNSPVRAQAVGRNKKLLQASKGAGAYLYLKNKQKLLDFVMGYGCLPFGHAHPDLVKFLEQRIKRGSSFGLTNTEEIKLAKNILKAFELNKNHRVRFVNSGSDAANLAIRLAQKFTYKTKIIKFQECYHGWGEDFFNQDKILEARFNNIQSVKDKIAKNKDKIAALIMEPFCANNGLIMPENNFLKQVEKICREEKIIFILDEVISAFRLHFGSAAQYFNINPDLILLGKTLSQGYPFGAVVGNKKILNHLAPAGDLFHAGTFNGNLLVCSAANFSLNYLRKNFAKLDGLAGSLKNIPQIKSIGSVFWIKAKNKKQYQKLYFDLLKKNIFISPSQDEVSFLSLAHQKSHIQKLINAL